MHAPPYSLFHFYLHHCIMKFKYNYLIRTRVSESDSDSGVQFGKKNFHARRMHRIRKYSLRGTVSYSQAQHASFSSTSKQMVYVTLRVRWSVCTYFQLIANSACNLFLHFLMKITCQLMLWIIVVLDNGSCIFLYTLCAD